MLKTEKSEILFERSKRIVPGGVHSPVRGFRGVGGVPRFMESAQGAFLRDVDGNEYIDYCMSWGPLLFGHRDPEVAEAVQRAMDRGWTYGTAEPYSLELAEFIVSKLSKHGVEKIRFVNSGTEAVMSALRVARAATGRSKIVKFDGCYHGHVDSLLVRAGSGLADMASPDSAGVPAETASQTVVLPLDDLNALQLAFRNFGKEIAAVIVEPLPANNGLLPQTDAFLLEIFKQAHANGALVIFDEVISGFRVAFGGMAEYTGLKPDLVTYGKVIGGGFPVGAYGGRKDLMSQVAPEGGVYQAGTLSANPVAMAAGLAMLKKLDHESPFGRLSESTRFLGRSLEAIAQEKGVRFQSQSVGSIFWGVFGDVEVGDGVVRSLGQVPTSHKENYVKFFHGLLNKGVYLAPSAFEVGFLSTAHTEALNDRFVAAAREVFEDFKR